MVLVVIFLSTRLLFHKSNKLITFNACEHYKDTRHQMLYSKCYIDKIILGAYLTLSYFLILTAAKQKLEMRARVHYGQKSLCPFCLSFYYFIYERQERMEMIYKMS
jgi:hypothetical protein